MHDKVAVLAALDQRASSNGQDSNVQSSNSYHKTKYIPKKFSSHPFKLNDNDFYNEYAGFIKGVINAELFYKTRDVSSILNLPVNPFSYSSRSGCLIDADFDADFDNEKNFILQNELKSADCIVTNIIRTCEGKGCSYFEKMYALTKHFRVEELLVLKKRLHHLIDDDNPGSKLLEGIVNMSAFDNAEKYKLLPRQDAACEFYRDLLPNIFNRVDVLTKEYSQKSA